MHSGNQHHRCMQHDCFAYRAIHSTDAYRCIQHKRLYLPQYSHNIAEYMHVIMLVTPGQEVCLHQACSAVLLSAGALTKQVA